MRNILIYIVVFLSLAITACSDTGSLRVDSHLMNYARYCHVDTLDSILRENNLEIEDYPELMKLRRLRVAEEISHTGTVYFDVTGIISDDSAKHETAFKDIIENSHKVTLLYFCNCKDFMAQRQLKTLSVTSSVTERYNIICVPMGTLKQRTEYAELYHYPNVSVFSELRSHSLLKGLYGINLSPSVVVIDSNGMIAARCKNIPSIYKALIKPFTIQNEEN